jgi:hypothetical protein
MVSALPGREKRVPCSSESVTAGGGAVCDWRGARAGARAGADSRQPRGVTPRCGVMARRHLEREAVDRAVRAHFWRLPRGWLPAEPNGIRARCRETQCNCAVRAHTAVHASRIRLRPTGGSGLHPATDKPRARTAGRGFPPMFDIHPQQRRGNRPEAMPPNSAWREPGESPFLRRSWKRVEFAGKSGQVSSSRPLRPGRCASVKQWSAAL